MTAHLATPVAADAEAIARVHVTCWQETYRGIVADAHLDQLSFTSKLKFWQQTLVLKDNFMLVARKGRALAGFISWGAVRAEPAHGADGEIYALYLLARYQGQGIGRQLYEAAARSWARHGGESLLVLYLAANTRAGAFYRAMGGTEVGSGYWGVAEQALEDKAARFDNLAALLN